MPLLDHFHPHLSAERRWESFHSSWATRIADTLTERRLPPNYIAEEHAHLGPSVEILRVMESAGVLSMPPESSLYAVAYQPLRRGQIDEINVWRSPLALGQPLPTLLLGLRADLIIPVDFEAAYAEACLRKRLPGS